MKIIFSKLHLVFLSLFFLSTCCNNYQISVEKTKLSFEDAKKILKTDSVELRKIADSFLENEFLFSLLRREPNNLVQIGNKNEVEYALTVMDSINISHEEYTVPETFAGKENEFWNQKPKAIVGTSGKNLNTFLSEYKIELDAFLSFQSFLEQKHFYVIVKSAKRQNVIFQANFTEGLIYSPHGENPVGTGINPEKIRSISEKWYYFKEDTFK